MGRKSEMRPGRNKTVFLSALLILGCSLPASTVTAQGRRGGNQRENGVYKSQVTPNWYQNNTRFWYRNDLRGGAKEFVVVDAEKGTRQLAFDHQRLAAELSKAATAEYRGDRLPFDSIEFLDDAGAIRFSIGEISWKCDLGTYQCTQMVGAPSTAPSARLDDELMEVASIFGDLNSFEKEFQSPQATETTQPASRGARGGRGGRGNRTPRSPDSKWTAFVKDQNVYVRSEPDGKEIQLSTDGKEGLAYARLEWSPDSTALVAFRVEPGERKDVYRVESAPRGGGRAVLHTDPYPLPGDKFDSLELNLFDVAAQRQIKPDVDRIDFGGGGGNPNPVLRWAKDGRHFSYQKDDRGHQRLRIVEVDARTGQSRNIIDEKTETFIWTAHTENLGVNLVNWLEKSDEIVYVSEHDGWRHMYLVNVKTGAINNQIDKGEFVLRGIDRIDEDNRQIWFRASGMNPKQDPYFIHYYRINFDGTELVALTEGDGNHTIQYSPDRKFIIDTYSRVDMPPVNELRQVSDGKLVCKLEESDITELKASGWEAPEVFVAKGRDGKTDIWGIIARPRNLDPTKKYPVLESIYNGPQSAYVPKSFSAQRRFSNLTDLGFIVVQADAMGTAFRSKAFHDVCWHNLGDAGFPDRILWHKAIGAKYPYYDLDRVGIYGTSAGGQNAAGAVVFHSDFYKAAVANSGCHDNRMDKSSWNEQWMGYPIGPQYSESSNIDNAAKLGGHLMLIVGEMDNNVPPESTYRFVDALTKLGKDFDFVMVPGANHGAASPVTQRRLQDFFLRHLQGIESPNRNAPRAG
jgi:dipeptidyl aminopeptidase/acylaminoacyl peptidase